jgi:tetrahydromethanopterin S-methyltransferase subunit G
MDWKTMGNYVLLAGLFIAMITMFNQVNARLDVLNDRIDRVQAETNGRLDHMQAETNGRLDRMQAETNARFEAVDARFDQMFDRMDRMQAENNRRFDAHQVETNRRFDAVLEAIMSFDRRVSRNEGQIEIIREQLQAEGSP